MSGLGAHIAAIPGDGIGVEVTETALALAQAALARVGAPALRIEPIAAGAGYYAETGRDIEPDGEARAGAADAIFLGAIGLPSVRAADGTEISPHLRLRDRFDLYAGLRPVKAYPNAPRRLADARAAEIDLVIVRESTEGLFYSAAAHRATDGRSVHAEAGAASEYAEETMRLTRRTCERLFEAAFRLAQKRRARGGRGRVTCVDKANVFRAFAMFRGIFAEVAARYPDIETSYAYVDAQALDLVRKPWDADVLVTENMFGDILSDLAGGLVGGMGLAACGEIGDAHALFQPAHGSAPDIMGQDKANPLAAALSGAMMLDHLAEKSGDARLETAGRLIEAAVAKGFAEGRLRPMEFGGDMGGRAMAAALAALVAEAAP